MVLQFLFSPNTLVRLIWFCILAGLVVIQYEILALCTFLIIIIGNIWMLYVQTQKLPRDQGIGSIGSIGGIGSIGSIGSEDVRTSDESASRIVKIAGPIENYQDNTWDEENVNVSITKIPAGLDIQGSLLDIPGYILN